MKRLFSVAIIVMLLLTTAITAAPSAFTVMDAVVEAPAVLDDWTNEAELSEEDGFLLGRGGCDYYNLIEKTDYNLAPGAVETEIILNDDNGSRRQVVHVIEVDPNNDNISVMPSFKNISTDVDYSDTDNWGIMEMSKQAAYVESELGKNVVGAMNVCLSWDFTHPYGLLVYEGKVLCDNRASCDTCGKGHPGGGYLVIYKDGKAELRDAMAELTGDEWMAQTVCFAYLVKDGVNVNAKEDHNDVNGAPRSVIGVKEDGTLVIMMVDGRMSPYSAGFTSHEMAQMMIDLGCVDAINCDGGGSSTFITEREGTGELTVKSRFSDGAERATLTGILVISKAVADGNFHHAAIEADNKLVTPGSTVVFTATGADSAGGPAEVPADVEWQLKDSSMGTIENGVFVSNGTVGEAVAQMVYNGEIVGEASVEVVIPNSFEFVMSNITAPYGKSVSLDMIAKYGYSEVTLKTDDIEYTLSNDAMGVIDEGIFTATDDESVSGGTVTATLVHNTSLTSVASITLGKGSEIVYDFEDGEESIAEWYQTYKSPYTPDKYYFDDEWTVVNKTTGKVRNGDYALKITCDGDSITCMNWCQTRMNGLNIDLTDAVSISFWMYVPEGSHGYEWDFGNAIPVVLGHECEYGTGWQYFTVNVADIGTNVTNLDQIKLYRSDTNNAGIGYNHYEHPNYYADVTFYIDDITVNYSSAVEDTDAPVISNACVSHSNIDTPVAMNGQNIYNNVVAFTANVTDNIGNTNYTGVDANSVVVYVDGVEVNATCSGTGMISTDDVVLANGVHTVVFEIADNNGNVTPYWEYKINISGEEEIDTIKYVPADPNLKDVPNDSVVWMNLVATAAENIDTVTTVIDLDQNSKWELDHMVLAKGFSATYTVDADSNDATIIIKNNGTGAEGETVIASLPVRVWSPAFMDNGGNEDASAYRLVSVMSYIQMGEIVFIDGETSTFSSDVNTITTEWNSTRLTSNVDKSGWHTHTITELEDVEGTCAESGYTGRTFCEVCNSVVDWGTSNGLAGTHEYAVSGNSLVCVCGETYTGNGLVTVSDSIYFLVADKLVYGWQFVGDKCYYFDTSSYKAATGNTEIANHNYVFSEDGVLLEGALEYTGEHYVYYWAGKLVFATWKRINEDMYYFGADGNAVTGFYKHSEFGEENKYYVFGEDGVLLEKINGIYIDKNGDVFFVENGEALYKGLVQDEEGNYYYINSSRKAVKNVTYGISASKTNGLLPAGSYTFGADGKMVVETESEPDTEEPVTKNGLVLDEDGEVRYYENGVAVYKGLVQDEEGNYYYINSSKKAVKNVTYGVSTSKTNGLLPSGLYTFGADGKMVVETESEPDTEEPVTKNGLVLDEDGEVRYYENGVAVYKGLVQDEEGNYYYINSSKKAVKNVTYGVSTSKTNGLLPSGLYTFGADGKMVVETESEPDIEEPVTKNGLVLDEDGEVRYYENGVAVYKGLVQDEEGNYYYINSSKKAVKNVTYGVSTSKTNGLLPSGLYTFGADGKMIKG